MTEDLSFTHLHNHSQYSLLDGLCAVEGMLDAARAHGMTHLALTDHGTMSGAAHFYHAARARDITPILGCEMYVARRARHKKETREDRGGHHLILLAQDMTGYRNLLTLATIAHLEGFHGKPRVDKEDLARHAGGLVCTSACLSSEIAKLLLDGQEAAAHDAADFYKQAFPGRYYIEVQDHGLEQDKPLNEMLVRLARDMNLPLVATNDVHYIEKEHATAQEVLLAIQTGTTMNDPTRLKMGTQEFYLKGPAEMGRLFGHLPQALANTRQIAEHCHLELPFGTPRLPAVPVPPHHTPESYLGQLCSEGLARRYAHVTEEMVRRLEYELVVIKQTGFAGYFLLLHDILHWTRQQGILVGAGRGSAVGSLAAYCLGITNVEPLELDLLFERFLNPDRLAFPDIDSDVEDDRRDEVVQYMAQRYGEDKVAQISIFGTMAARAALKDAGRALGLSYAETDGLCKLIPPKSDLAGALAVPEFLAAYQNSPRAKEAVEAARKLETTTRTSSVHASGIVVAPQPLLDLVPLCRPQGAGGRTATQYGFEDLERLGLVKVDILGLSNLRLLRHACREVERTTGQSLDPEALDLHDPALYRLLSRGETVGIFQLESAGMVSLLRQMQPERFRDVMAAVALYRPGPMDYIDAYVLCKHGRARVSYLHDDLAPILRETYGVIVYQDDVIRIALDLAGLTWGQVDKLRKAMGKKLPEEMRKQKETFLAGFARTTKWQYGPEPDGTIRAHEVPKPPYSAALAEQLWEQVVTFAGYGFNRAHAAAYATLACQTAYLKAHHPLPFMSALLTTESANTERLSVALAESRRMGIEILLPAINQAAPGFHVEGGRIRYGLAAIRNMGGAAVEAVLSARAEGPFGSAEDAVERLVAHGQSERVLESLVKAGALDEFGERPVLLARLHRWCLAARKEQQARARGQMALFSSLDAAAPPPDQAVTSEDLATPDQVLTWEKEMLGLYVSEHPLHNYRTEADLARAQVGDTLPEVAVQVTSCRTLSTKKEEPMAVLDLEDLTGRMPAVCFPRAYEKLGPLLQAGALLRVCGTITERNEAPQLVIEDAVPVDSPTGPVWPARSNGARPNNAQSHGAGRSGPAATGARQVPQTSAPVRPAIRRLVLHLPRDADVAERMMDIVQDYPPRIPVELRTHSATGQTRLFTHAEVRPLFTTPEPELLERLRRLLGPKGVEVHHD